MFVTVFLYNAYGWKDVLKVEYNGPHTFASKLRGFPFTVQTNTVSYLWESKTMADRVSRRVWVWPAMQTDPIFSCFAASSSNTLGRHCRKNAKKNLFWNVQTRDSDLHVHGLCIKANSASIDVTKGVGGVNPLNNFIYFFNIQIVTNNYLNKLFYCYLFIYP